MSVKKTCLILGRHVVCGQKIIVQYKIIIFTWHVSRVDKVTSQWCPVMSRWGTYLCQTPWECPDYGTYIGPKFCPNLSGCAPTYENFTPNSSGQCTYLWVGFQGSFGWLVQPPGCLKKKPTSAEFGFQTTQKHQQCHLSCHKQDLNLLF